MDPIEFLDTLPTRKELEWDEVQPRKKPRTTTTTTGLSIDQDSFTVEEIRRRPLPRDDGYPNDLVDLRDAPHRPYGREYLNEHAERQRLLEQHPDYRLIKRIAGAMRKNTIQLFEEEDLILRLQERESERVTEALEKKRTLVGVEQKYENMQRLKLLRAETRAQHGEMLTRTLVPEALQRQSREFAGEESSGASASRTGTSFQALLTRHRKYTLVQTAVDKSAPSVTEILRALEALLRGKESALLEAIARLADKLPLNRLMVFVLDLFYRDFLNNHAALSLTDYIIQDQDYVEANRELYSSVKSERVETKAERNVRVLHVQTALSIVPSMPIDWHVLYRGTETIHMDYYESLRLGEKIERLMVEEGCLSGSFVNHPSFCANILATLYPTATEVVQKSAFTLTNSVHTPPEIIGLIERQFPDFRAPDFKADADIKLMIGAIVKSHLLWLYFHKRPRDEIVRLLGDQVQRIGTKMMHTLVEATAFLKPLFKDYKQLMDNYLLRLAAYLNTQPAVFFPLPTTTGQPLEDEEWKRHDWRLEALVQDKPFLSYLQSGQHPFVSAVLSPALATPAPQAQPRKLSRPEQAEYPALLLQPLFLAYREYTGIHARFLESELEHAERALQKAQHKIATLLAEEKESSSAGEARGRNPAYAQKRSFTTQPANSGFVEIRAEIVELISTAWHNVQQYCPELRDLPLSGYQSDRAWETGLTGQFARYVAALDAYKELSFPENYRSQQHHAHVTKCLKEALTQLQKYSLSGGRQRVEVNLDARPSFDLGFAGARQSLVEREPRPQFSMMAF